MDKIRDDWEIKLERALELARSNNNKDIQKLIDMVQGARRYLFGLRWVGIVEETYDSREQLAGIAALTESGSDKGWRHLLWVSEKIVVGGELPGCVVLPDSRECCIRYKYPNARGGLRRLLEYERTFTRKFEAHAFEGGSYDYTDSNEREQKNGAVHALLDKAIDMLQFGNIRQNWAMDMFRFGYIRPDWEIIKRRAGDQPIV